MRLVLDIKDSEAEFVMKILNNFSFGKTTLISDLNEEEKKIEVSNKTR